MKDSSPRWRRRSSRCQQETCVYVTGYDTHVEVDNRPDDTATLRFTASSWSGFIRAIRAGEMLRPQNH